MDEEHPPRFDSQTSYADPDGPGGSKMETVRRARRSMKVQRERADSAAAQASEVRPEGPEAEPPQAQGVASEDEPGEVPQSGEG